MRKDPGHTEKKKRYVSVRAVTDGTCVCGCLTSYVPGQNVIKDMKSKNPIRFYLSGHQPDSRQDIWRVFHRHLAGRASQLVEGLMALPIFPFLFIPHYCLSFFTSVVSPSQFERLLCCRENSTSDLGISRGITTFTRSKWLHLRVNWVYNRSYEVRRQEIDIARGHLEYFYFWIIPLNTFSNLCRRRL